MSNMKIVDLFNKKILLTRKLGFNDSEICEHLYLAGFRYQKLIDQECKVYQNSKELFEKEKTKQSFYGHISGDCFTYYVLGIEADFSKIPLEANFMETDEAKFGFLICVESFWEDTDQSNWKMSEYVTKRWFTSEFVGMSEKKYKELFLSLKNK